MGPRHRANSDHCLRGARFRGAPRCLACRWVSRHFRHHDRIVLDSGEKLAYPSKPVRFAQIPVIRQRRITGRTPLRTDRHRRIWRREIGDKDKWELYSLDDDFSEAKNLAAKNPEKLAELKRLFNEKAKSIPSRRGAFVRAQALAGRLRSEAHEIRVLRRRFQACGDRRTNTKNRSHSITTVIEMPKTGGEGVIVAEGSKSAGFACTCRTANSYTVTIGSSGN